MQNKTKQLKSTSKSTTTMLDKKWMNNPDQKKTPKIFTFSAIRNVDGSFQILDGSTCGKRVNQYKTTFTPVDTAALTDELATNKIYFN